MSAFEDLKLKLREIFQLDRTDLDFGLYRIMNLKSAEVSKFIDNELLPQVQDGLKKYALTHNTASQEDLDKLIETLRSAGVDPETSPKVQELRQKLNSAFDANKVEAEIYSDLYNFFKRYYSEGDFLSLRRYKDGVYALPYEGQEVKLHWANADQYYIKSSEDLTNYTFKIADQKIRFEVVDAKLEQNNNKGDADRRFRLIEEEPVKKENDIYIVSFSYLPDPAKTKQEILNKQIATELLSNTVLQPLSAALSANTSSDISVLLRHINNFTAKHTFDYFIHKDLGGFLRRELDFYIKNEIMHLDDIESDTAQHVESYLCKIKVFKSVANKIITFLSSVEEFQKKLWLKKKFVLETNYCITLDRVPDNLYAEICNNQEQIKEWINLFAIDELEGFSNPLKQDFLKTNKYLVLDTAFFSTDFKYKLIGSIDNIDKQCDGVLVNADNFQYLNLAQEKLYNSINCIYIDPPYNTGNDGFVYKDNYQHSSWLTMMKDRILQAKQLLSEGGTFFASIDDNELLNLKSLFNIAFEEEDFLAQFNWMKTSTPPSLSNKVRKKFEYILGYAKNYNGEGLNGGTTQGGDMPLLNESNAFVKLVFDKDSVFFKIPDGFYSKGTYDRVVLEEDINIINGKSQTDLVLSGNFKWQQNTVDEEIKNGTIFHIKTDKFAIRYERIGERIKVPSNVISKEECCVGTNEDGKKDLIKLFNSCPLDYPKPVSLMEYITSLKKNNEAGNVLDFFAGSGTTGHAVIKLNRETPDSSRKYFLVEMGKYFDLVTKPRMEKVVYSKEWNNGKPVDRDGISQCFKYIRLESYEDTLDNLEFSTNETQIDLLSTPVNKHLKEQYMLNYMMDIETKGSLLSVSDFNHPYDYELKITRDGEAKTVKVDLIETFNYLIGLNVTNIRKSQGIVVIEGKTRSGENTLVLWRDTDEVSNTELDAWFAKQKYSTQDMEFDVIYVNGNNNLENLRKSDETWKVRLTEAEFLKRMFDVKDI